MTRTSENEKFNYKLLSRLEQDCKYYLGHGNRSPKHLWAGDEKAQIEKMKELWNGFAGDKKPEWLTMEQIEGYEKQMQNALIEEFDDIETNDGGKKWSRVCKSCIKKLNIPDNMLDEEGSGRCGVKGCLNEASYYVDF